MPPFTLRKERVFSLCLVFLLLMLFGWERFVFIMNISISIYSYRSVLSSSHNFIIFIFISIRSSLVMKFVISVAWMKFVMLTN